MTLSVKLLRSNVWLKLESESDTWTAVSSTISKSGWLHTYYVTAWPWPLTFWPQNCTVSYRCHAKHFCIFWTVCFAISELDGQTEVRTDGQTGW